MNIPVDLQTGASTRATPLARDLLAQDSRPLELALTAAPNHFPPAPLTIKAEAYFDRAIAAQEKEAIWKRTWQMVGRLEDIPEVGDRFPYDVAGLSYIVVRSAPDRIRAFENSCRHRGTRLCNSESSGAFFRCPFHGWQWNLDGELEEYRAQWDFTHHNGEDLGLVEAQIDTWGGFIFMNPDPSAGPLHEALGVLVSHFAGYDAENRYTALRIRKKLRCNWKIAVEAFLETYHSPETHPDTNDYHGAEASQYDIWDDGLSHVSRLIMVMGVPPVHLGDAMSRSDAARALVRNLAAASLHDLTPPQITSDEACRTEVADWLRKILKDQTGLDYSERSDAFMIDGIQYFVFPHFFPWWGEAFPLSYQFLPIGNNPAECMVEFRLLQPKPTEGPCPESPEVLELDFDTRFTDVAALRNSTVWQALNQDLDNMASAQAGLEGRFDSGSELMLARYQDSRIAHFHEVIQSLIARLG